MGTAFIGAAVAMLGASVAMLSAAKVQPDDKKRSMMQLSAGLLSVSGGVFVCVAVMMMMVRA